MRARLELLLVVVAACHAPRQPSAADHNAPLLAADGGKPRSDCYACHARDYHAAHHHEGVKPTRCAVCHVETGWHPTQRNHPWPLTGAHDKADCFACHSGKPPVYEDTPDTCVGCHRADYDNSEYPGHDRFPLTCADCHGTSAWKPAKKPENKPEPGAAGARAPHAQTKPAASKPAHDSTAARDRPTPKHAQPAEAPPPESAAPSQPDTPPPSAANERKHPESAFPITTGNHVDIECETCHDGAGRMGKGNTDCVQCHKRSRFDRKHVNVTAYPSGEAPPNFCVECHTRGTRATRGGH